MAVVDDKKAHLYGKVPQGEGQHYVQAPAEAYNDGMCWRLLRWV